MADLDCESEEPNAKSHKVDDRKPMSCRCSDRPIALLPPGEISREDREGSDEDPQALEGPGVEEPCLDLFHFVKALIFSGRPNSQEEEGAEAKGPDRLNETRVTRVTRKGPKERRGHDMQMREGRTVGSTPHRHSG